MKAVQVFLSTDRLASGIADQWWIRERDRYFSFVLSHLQIKKHYSDIVLVTDREGKSVLIDQFKLAYNEVHVVLDDLHQMLPIVTQGLAKIFACAQFSEPFAFVDESTFLWDGFSLDIETGAFALYAEDNHDAVLRGMDQLQPVLSDIPENEVFQNKAKQSFSNRLLGCFDSQLFKDYYLFISDILQKHKYSFNFSSVEEHAFDAVMQEYLLACYCQVNSIPVHFLLDQVIEERQLNSINVFESHPQMAVSYIPDALKAEPNTLRNLSFTFKALYPDHHHRIDTFCIKTYPSYQQHVFSTTKQTPPSNSFTRTLKAVEILFPDLITGNNQLEASPEIAAKQIEDIINTVDHSSEKQFLEDVFSFEKSKYEFSQLNMTTSTSRESESKKLSVYNHFFGTADGALANPKLVSSKHYKITDSLWKWGVHLEIDTLYPLRVIYNLPMPAGNFQTLFWRDQESELVHEYDLQQFDSLFLECFKHPANLDEALSIMCQYFDDEQPQEDLKESIRPLANTKLKEFLLMGALDCADSVK